MVEGGIDGNVGIDNLLSEKQTDEEEAEYQKSNGKENADKMTK